MTKLPNTINFISFCRLKMSSKNSPLEDAKLLTLQLLELLHESHQHLNHLLFRNNFSAKGETALYHRSNTPFFLGSLGSKLIPDLAPPMAGPDTVNLISIVFANDKTSFMSRPLRIRVPPPAAPPRNELITVQPSASVSGSFQLNTISGAFFFVLLK